jgi:hypothetical protein
MPKCLICQNNIPRRVKVEGKYKYISTNRKYCFECSPYNCHNTKKIDKTLEGRKCICKKCGKIYEYVRSKGYTLNTCSSCIQSKRRIRLKRYIMEKVGKNVLFVVMTNV